MSTLCVNCRVCRINNKTDTKTPKREQRSASETKAVLLVHREYCGNFSMAAGVTSCITKGGLHIYHQGQRVSYKLPAVSQSTIFFPACFKKRCYLVGLAEQRARQTGWPPLYNWRPYKYILQRPPLSHWTVSALQHWNYLSPSARIDQ